MVGYSGLVNGGGESAEAEAELELGATETGMHPYCCLRASLLLGSRHKEPCHTLSTSERWLKASDN